MQPIAATAKTMTLIIIGQGHFDDAQYQLDKKIGNADPCDRESIELTSRTLPLGKGDGKNNELKSDRDHSADICDPESRCHAKGCHKRDHAEHCHQYY